MSVYAKGMIFAAGLGTRLRPFTLEHPKALVDVCGRPALARVIDRVVDIGINDITVNVHHFASQVEKYLSEHAPEGVTIHISDESDKLLDTGGGLVHAMRYLDGDAPVLVHNADIISDIDLHDILECHCRTGASITMAKGVRFVFAGGHILMITGVLSKVVRKGMSRIRMICQCLSMAYTSYSRLCWPTLPNMGEKCHVTECFRLLPHM